MSDESLPVQIVKPAGTSAAQAEAIQGVTGGVPVAVTGTFSASTSAKATAAAPTYVEGTDSPISQDLNGNLRTLASVSATTTAKATAADPAYAEGSDSAISQDRTGHLRTTAVTDTQLRASALPVSAASLPLPTGAALEAGNLATLAGKDFATQTTLALIKAKTDNLDVALSTKATSALQTTGNTSLASIDGKLILPAALDGSGFLKVHEQGTAAISAVALPLPSGAATALRQDTGNTSLASIDTKLTNPLPVSQGTAAAGSGAWPVELTEDTTNTVVKPGDATNKAVRVNVVANVGASTFFNSRETPTGTVNGTTGSDGNATFTLAHTPTGTVFVYVDGLLQLLGTHYTISGVTITFLAPWIPVTGSWVEADYNWSLTASQIPSTLVIDVNGNVQPTGDSSARSIHVTVDSATSLPLPSGAATAAGVTSMITALTDANQILQRYAYAQLAQQRAGLYLQAAISGQAVFLPEMPAFLGVA